MRNTLILSLSLAAVTFTATAQAAPAAVKPNTLTSAEKKAGWKLLFDGKTTKGWRGFKKPEAPTGWTVQDGILARTDKGGDLMTDEEFSDFEFQTDWKLEEAGNSGIIYRASETESAPYMTGPEYQLLDDEKHPDGKAGKDGNRKSGSLYDVYAASKNVVKLGDWNSTRIVVSGNHVEHWLNGEKVVEAEIGSPEWTSRVGASKWAKVATYATTKAGHIDLQDHGAKVEFRNIKILDLTKAPAKKAKK